MPMSIKILSYIRCFLIISIIFPAHCWPYDIDGGPIAILRPAVIGGDNYYVSQSGSGTQDGKSSANAWAMSDVANDATNWDTSENADKIDPGDTLNLAEDITSKLTIQISGVSGKPITIKGGKIDRNGGDQCIYATEKSYITIDDVECTDFDSDAGILFYNGCHYITFTNNYIHDGVDRGIFVTAGGAGESYNSNITIGTSGNGNIINDIGENTAGMDIGVAKTDTVYIGYNELKGSAGKGIDGILFEYVGTNNNDPEDNIVEYNEIEDHLHAAGEDGIDVKKFTQNVTFKRNYIAGNTKQTGIVLHQDATGPIVIENNWFHGNGDAVLVYDHCVSDWTCDDPGDPGYGETPSNVRISGNIITDNNGDGIVATKSGDSGYGDPEPWDQVKAYNNTIKHAGEAAQYSSSKHSVRITHGSSHEVINNISYDPRPNLGDTYQSYYLVGIDTLDGNVYYDPNGTATFYYDGSWRTLATLQSSYSKETNGAEDDPEFEDVSTNDLDLDTGSPCLSAAVSGPGSITLFATMPTSTDPTTWTFVTKVPEDTGAIDD